MGKDLLLRIVAAIGLGLGLLGAYALWGNDGLLYGTLLVSFLSLREYHRMVFSDSENLVAGILFWTAALGMLFVYFFFKEWLLPGLGAITSIYLSANVILNRERVKNEQLLKSMTSGVFGFFYCVCCPLFVANLLSLEKGHLWMLYLLLVIFSGDTMAFFGGKTFGRHKLNPSLSPKKTVEGAVSGIFGSLIVSLGFALYFYPEASLVPFVLFGVGCGIVGQTGDLLVSLIKRVHNVKDSGRIIPGHGGILDRVDGVLIACPLVYTFALLMH